VSGACGLIGLIGGFCDYLYDINAGKRNFNFLAASTAVITGWSTGACVGLIFHDNNIFYLLPGCYASGFFSFRLVEAIRDRLGFLIERIIKRIIG
jgi:hypothetical protein